VRRESDLVCTLPHVTAGKTASRELGHGLHRQRTVGKTWGLEFTDDHPNNKHHKSETRKLEYRVVGWEDVEVPAGKFKALKIEAEGSWSGEIAPRSTTSIPTASATRALPTNWNRTQFPTDRPTYKRERRLELPTAAEIEVTNRFFEPSATRRR